MERILERENLREAYFRAARGKRNKRDAAVFWPTTADCERALRDFAEYRLSRNLELPDALIGQASVGINEKRATFNMKHYGVVTGLSTVRPY